VLRIRDVYPGSLIRLFSIPDPNCFHPGSRIRIKEFKYYNPQKIKINGLCPFAVYYLRYAVRSFFTLPRISLADGKTAGQKVHRKIAAAVQKVKTPLLFSRSFEIPETNCQQSYLR
jgi:hypothetical protein